MSLPEAVSVCLGGLDLRGAAIGLEDLDELEGIEAVNFITPWSRALLEQEVCLSWRVWNMAFRDDSRLLAYFFTRRVDGELHLLNFSIHPDVQRRGLGGDLLAWLVGAATRDACDIITLEVRESNTPAIGLYKKGGFHLQYRRPRYYRDNGEDALVMTLNLDRTKDA